jgi:hypothetical protein
MTLDASVRYSKSANPTLVETNAILSTAAASPLAPALRSVPAAPSPLQPCEVATFVEMQIEIQGVRPQRSMEGTWKGRWAMWAMSCLQTHLALERCD